MKFLTANTAGPIRTDRLNGREHVVAPVVMIVPGVLPGSKGRLYYPAPEVRLSADAWNGMPLTNGHPKADGVFVSARRPDVLRGYQIGTVFNARYDGRLVAEAWFDVELTARLNPTLLADLRAGKVREVSTGLFTRDLPAANGAVDARGRPYDYVATNYRPDHLAVLTGEAGACSVRDGCGVLVNSYLEVPMNKAELVAWLTANCDCWKGAETALNQMDEAQLKKVKAGAEVAARDAAVANAAVTTFEINLDEVPVANVGCEMKKKAKAMAKAGGDADEEDMEANGKGKKPAVNAGTPAAKPADQTLDQWEATMPAAARPIWNAAKQLEANARAALVERIVTANAKDDAAKAELRKVYGGMDSPTLQKIADALPTANGSTAQDQGVVHYFGAAIGGTPARNSGRYVSPDGPLVLPSFADQK